MKPRLLKFARALFAGQSQTAAAEAAGYTGSRKTLHKRGSLLARRPEVIAELARLNKLAEDELVLTKLESERFLSRAVRCKITDFCNDDGALDLSRAKKLGVLDLIDGYEIEPLMFNGAPAGTRIKIKLCRKLDANAQLRALKGWDAPIRQQLEVETKTDLSRLSLNDLLAKADALREKLCPKP